MLDYPNHLARNFVLAHVHDPAYRFGDWYRADWGPFPYLGMDLILVSLQHLVAVKVAGKIFLSLCLLAVPLSVWWLVRTANPGNDALAFWGLLLAYGNFFLNGFINYQLGLAFCFVTITLWLRYLDRASLRRWLLVLAAATATYFAHLVAFILAGFVIFVYTLAEKRRWRAQLLASAPFVPGVVIYVLSGIARQSSYAGELYFRDWWPEKFFDGLGAYTHGYSGTLDTIVLWATLAAIILAFVRNPAFRLRRSWVVVFVAILALYCALPDEIGESWDIDIRVIPVVFVVLLLVAQVGRRHRILGAIGLLLVLARLGDTAYNFSAKQPELARLDAVIQSIPRDSTVLPLINEHDEEDFLERPWVHFWAYAVIERGTRAPYLFDLPGQTTLRIVPRAYIPARPLADNEIDFDRVRRDYDFVWLYDLPQYAPELAARGQVSHRTGDLTLYRMPSAQRP